MECRFFFKNKINNSAMTMVVMKDVSSHFVPKTKGKKCQVLIRVDEHIEFNFQISQRKKNFTW